MYTLIIVLIVISAILLTFLVLVQNSKGGGLAAGFSSSNQIMGVRKTTDFLEKATWTLVIVMVVLAIGSVAFRPKALASSNESELKEKVQQVKDEPQQAPAAPFTAPQTAPAAPTAPAKK
jgi:preprotein translocase subunit SecG